MTHTITDVVSRGLCIGCGACAIATDGQVPIRINKDGMYAAGPLNLTEDALAAADKVCPFSDGAMNEDAISLLVHDDELTNHEFLGRYSKTYAGRVSDQDYLEGASSGGLTSWMLGQLIERGVVDAVINVGRQEDPLFGYEASDADQVIERRKSDYYSVTLDGAMQIVRDTDKKFALVGVPCFIKAARLLAEEDVVLKERLAFFVGLVCGHMKSQYFGESMAWQLGIEPPDLKAVDFRVKNPERRSSDYDFGAQSKADGQWRYRRTGDLLGGNWGYAAFQPEACNFCDDIFAETADVAFGDAWLPQYQQDWRGTNVAITRNKLADEILATGSQTGALQLEDLPAEQAAKSQSGNFRHRRLGVQVRLADDIARGLSVPKKRVEPDVNAVDAKRLKIIRTRRKLSRLSFVAYRKAREAGDLNIYMDAMNRGIKEYRRIDRPLWRRVAGKLKAVIRSAIRR